MNGAPAWGAPICPFERPAQGSPEDASSLTPLKDTGQNPRCDHRRDQEAPHPEKQLGDDPRNGEDAAGNEQTPDPTRPSLADGDGHLTHGTA